MQHSKLKKIVLIGASTGGPGQIRKIIKSLPPLNDTSLVIAQHMAEEFLDSFASQLRHHTDNETVLIEDELLMQEGKIYLCKHTTYLDMKKRKFVVDALSTKSYNPDINTLFHSFVPMADKMEILSVILTGIGEDGAVSSRELSKAGARCITESKESAIIDGMPNRARAMVANIEIYDIETIAEKVREFCS